MDLTNRVGVGRKSNGCAPANVDAEPDIWAHGRMLQSDPNLIKNSIGHQNLCIQTDPAKSCFTKREIYEIDLVFQDQVAKSDLNIATILL